MKLVFFMLWAIAFTCVTAIAQEPKRAEPAKADRVLNLWPDQTPEWKAPTEPERDTSGPDGRDVAGRSVIRLGNVTVPQLHWYQAEAEAAHADTVILVCPGGGYSILAWDLEGTEIAERFRSLGYTTGVIKYRVPTRQSGEPWLAPVQDIQRAISLVRSELVDSKADKTRIGLVGFSAGGNAAARVATATKRWYEPIDKIDESSASADFVGLIYPWLMIESKKSPQDPPITSLGIIPELTVNEDCPAMFFAHTVDDPISCRNSLELFAKVQDRSIPAELHIFGSGGHGFGARDPQLAAASWPELMDQWLKKLPQR